MAYDSYQPLLHAIWSGQAVAKTYRDLDTLLLEDLPEHKAESARSVFETLLCMGVRWASTDPRQCFLYDAIHAHGCVRHLLSLRFMEKDYPELVDPATCVAAAKKLRTRFRAWLSRIHDDELYYAVFDDLIDDVVASARLLEVEVRERIRSRCAAIHEELVAAVFAPRRVAAWMEAGLEIEAL